MTLTYRFDTKSFEKFKTKFRNFQLKGEKRKLKSLNFNPQAPKAANSYHLRQYWLRLKANFNLLFCILTYYILTYFQNWNYIRFTLKFTTKIWNDMIFSRSYPNFEENINADQIWYIYFFTKKIAKSKKKYS